MTKAEQANPFVSVVTLNWNQAQITCAFLKSTQSLVYKNYEILVCDMGSDTDPSAQILKGNYPNTKILLSGKNRGFAGGNNWAIKQAKGDYIFFVNNDTEVTPELLNVLLEPFFEDETIGVICPKIRFFYNPDIIQYAGYNKMNLITGRVSAKGWLEPDIGQHDVPGYTNGAHGCAMMVKKEVIEKAGMFTEEFFMYYEDWDWSLRIIKAGYKIYYEPKGLIFHKQSMTIGKNSPLKVYYQTRNRILLIKENASFVQFFLFVIFFSLISVPKAIFTYLYRGQFKHLSFFFKGVFNVI